MTKGIFLVSFGKRGYSYAAYNMAVSLKHFNPDLKIALFHDKSIFDHIAGNELHVFDQFIEIPEKIKFTEGVLDPCRVKINMCDYLPFDYNLYLDVDGIALQDLSVAIDELITLGGHYYTHVFDSKTLLDGNQNDQMVWAWMSDIYEHYKLSEDVALPSTNSSFQFIKKCEKSKELFAQIQKNYEIPIPIERLRLRWGGGQPDELYLNVALAQLGWEQTKHYTFLGNRLSEMTFEEIERNFYILSIFGGKGFTREMYMEWYDRKLFDYFEAQGKEHRYKRNSIIHDKHANQTNSKVQMVAPVNPFMQKADFKISETTLIEPTNLIQAYKAHTNKDLQITNWLNPSFIDFKGKKIMVYRMESVPFCTTTKIGICYLDDNLQPIAGTSKLLDLYSNLSGIAPGYHVEDPRLFIHNDELYISYTDGYTLGQAKIDTASLTASESFYLKKPAQKKTEKNWTFFSHQGKLYSVYSINPHVIYEINGSDYKVSFETEFNNSWKWGELRGGTSPVLTDDGYLSFFHSSIDSIGGYRQYFMGAYLFESKPPFKPIAISKQPIIAGEMIPTHIQRLSTKIYVVFPGGVIRDQDGWNVAFGYNDYQCRIIKVKDLYLQENFTYLNQLVEQN
jgi:predicted GH43/DUF377 family glycosyl hydrolase